MRIDTRYTRDGGMHVDFVLTSPKERALTDDSLARIGCNQDALIWPEEGDDVEPPPTDLRFLQIPDDCANYKVTRDGDVVTVAYAPYESTHGLALAIAALFAISFDELMRYGALLSQ